MDLRHLRERQPLDASERDRETKDPSAEVRVRLGEVGGGTAAEGGEIGLRLLPRRTGLASSAVHISSLRGKANPGGITPTTVWVESPRRIERPRTSGSPPKLDCRRS